MQRNWYVVYTKPHKEDQVQLHLSRKHMETFFPRLRRSGRNGAQRAIIPLFPNYLFVRFDVLSEAHLVMWSPGVKRIVSCGENPVPLDESFVQFLKSRADASGVIHAHSRLRAGQRVEITGGPFDGFSGIIENPPNAKGRVEVLLNLLSRPVSVKLDVERIRNQALSLTPADNDL